MVVALAGATVGHGVGVILPRDLHQISSNEGPAQSGRQRVLLLINRPGLQAGDEEFIDQRLFAVDGHRVGRADGEGPLANGFQVDHPQVRSQRDYISAILFLEPRDGHSGIQTTAISEDDSVLCHCVCGLRLSVH